MATCSSFGAVESLAKDYLKFASRGDDKDKLRTILTALDCAVLQLYALPMELEHSLLKLFADYDRVGVRFEQTQYFPNGFQHPVGLGEFLSMERDWPSTNRLRGQLIDKDIEGTISEDERDQLNALQAYADFYLNQTTPRSTKELNEIEDQIFRRSSNKDATD